MTESTHEGEREKAMNVTKDHVINAKSRPGHKLDMSAWGNPHHPCGTAGCKWGTAYFDANGSLPRFGPPPNWINQSPWHQTVYEIFFFTEHSEEDIDTLVRGVREDGSIWLEPESYKRFSKDGTIAVLEFEDIEINTL